MTNRKIRPDSLCSRSFASCSISVAADLKPAPQADSIPHRMRARSAAGHDTTSAEALSSETPSGPIGTASANTSSTANPRCATPHTAEYTVVKGDSLTKISEKFNTTRKKLEALNNSRSRR